MAVWNQEIKLTSNWGGVWNQESKFTSKMTTRIYNLDV